MKRINIIFIFLVSACVIDSINITELANDTGEDIAITLFLDRQYVYGAGVGPREDVLKHYADRAEGYLVSVDTIATSATFTIPKGQTIDFFDGTGPTPDFSVLQKLIVKANGVNKEYSGKELKESVRKEGKNWVWRVR
ncbi:hypothetical protein GWC95_13180 [Sediminibacterium roseum]|uniref:Uncharacterized protein n=1 Tax=Sediminibacterium roseum TaxID=1978412 RepID=A0ABX0A0X3_9BACT|nr:hypothetical protein [Sediminibacterium roseum]NCI50885.1 hypothetical protein [Sediminibacterium roseum]